MRRTADAQGGVFRQRLVQTHVAFFPHDRLQLLGDHQFGRQGRKLLVNISRPEADNEISRSKHIADITMDVGQPWLIGDAGMAVRRNLLGDNLAGDSRNR